MICLLVSSALLNLAGAAEAQLTFKDAALRQLAAAAPGLRSTYDPDTGRFGTGIWICRDQHIMYPLAALYATEGEDNPYYKNEELLECIMKAGDCLIDEADENGQWVFRKKDGSTWGDIHMPWTYSRWVRAYSLIKDDMPEERRLRWEDALTLGYGKIADGLDRVHNIPTHHAMGLYIAGEALGKPQWCERAAAFMRKVVSTQREGGYWSEGAGPVVGYNFVYVDALGTYYAVSGDKSVLPTIERAAAFHRHFTYPNGANVETVDERNPYHEGVSTGNVGFTFSPDGRAWLAQQWAESGGVEKLSADALTSHLLYGEEGPVSALPEGAAEDLFVLAEDGIDRAATLRKGPWFVSLSAYHAPVPESRWLQDRQNLISIYHDRVGVFLGGGNTKCQPAWSTFTVGDMSLLKHTPGDESPDFLPKGELHHVPSKAALTNGPGLGLDLAYGPETCQLRVRPLDDKALELELKASAKSGMPVAAHLTLLPRLGQELTSASGRKAVLGENPIAWTAEDLGGGLTYAGCRFALPPAASVHWPAKRHNPYRKDGRSTRAEDRIEIRIPFDTERPAHTVRVEVLD